MYTSLLITAMAPVALAIPWGPGYQLPKWPPANSLTTINTPRDAPNVFTIQASTHIDAPASIIWDVIRNTAGFPEWNTFTPSAIITDQPNADQLPEDEKDFLALGAKFTYEVVLDKRTPDVKTPSFEQVSDVSTPDHPSTYVPEDILKNDGSFYPDLSRVLRIAWITDPTSDVVVQGGLYTERFNEIIPMDDLKGEEAGKNAGCEYRTWEMQAGPYAVGVKDKYGDLLQEDFEIWARDLKKESEKQTKEEKHPRGVAA